MQTNLNEHSEHNYLTISSANKNTLEKEAVVAAAASESFFQAKSAIDDDEIPRFDDDIYVPISLFFNVRVSSSFTYRPLYVCCQMLLLLPYQRHLQMCPGTD